MAPNRVRVSGARGYPPTATYKVCVSYDDGWRAVAYLPIIGIEAVAKAERQAGAIFDLTRRDAARPKSGPTSARPMSKCWAAEANFGAHARQRGAREVICRIAVEHDDKRAVDLFAREQVRAR